MELFLLIAIGLTVISFISIALTKPSPASIQELVAEPSTAEVNIEENAEARDPSTALENIDSEIAEQELDEGVLIPMALFKNFKDAY